MGRSLDSKNGDWEMRVLIHGGFHKTGTTAFQRSTFLRLPELSHGRIIYNPTSLYTVLTDHWKRDIFWFSERERSEINLFFDELSAETIFISAECFSGNLFNGYRFEMHKDKVIALKELMPAGVELHFLFTVREPKSWIISAYREAIKDHHYKTFEQFIEEFEFSDEGCLMLSQEKLLGAIVEQGLSLTVLSYESLRDDNRVMIEAISKICHEKIDTLTPARNNNKSLDWRYIEFLMTIKNSPFSFVLPRPIYFKGDRSIYKIEHQLNSTMLGRLYKRIFFLYRRGRWLRYITRALSQYAGGLDADYETKADREKRDFLGRITICGSGWGGFDPSSNQFPK